MLLVHCLFFFFKQKTAYEMRISDWSSDVCSSDLDLDRAAHRLFRLGGSRAARFDRLAIVPRQIGGRDDPLPRSEEHTSELQSLMRISYAVFCLKKKTTNINKKTTYSHYITQCKMRLSINKQAYIDDLKLQ